MQTASLRRPLLPALVLLLAGCGDNQDPAGADAFWQSIHDDKYTAFAHAPGYDKRTPSSAPHGDEVIIFVNDTVANALKGGSALTAWPEGSLIVKEGYDSANLDLVAAMEKRSDGWYWAEWDADGKALFSGKPKTCTNCHEAGSDFVRAFSLPE